MKKLLTAVISVIMLTISVSAIPAYAADMQV